MLSCDRALADDIIGHDAGRQEGDDQFWQSGKKHTAKSARTHARGWRARCGMATNCLVGWHHDSWQQISLHLPLDSPRTARPARRETRLKTSLRKETRPPGRLHLRGKPGVWSPRDAGREFGVRCSRSSGRLSHISFPRASFPRASCLHCPWALL